MSKPIRPLAAALVLAASVFLPSAHSQPAKPQAHETNIDGVTAEIAEAQRKEGVLTLKVRYRNSGAKEVSLNLIGHGGVNSHYLTAGSTKLMVLRDSKNTPLMPALDGGGGLYAGVKPGGSYVFWIKFPAPPADAKKVSYYSPLMPPIEDIPIMEAK